MAVVAQLALVVGVVFAVNLLPAFGPPTWAILVFFSLQFGLPPVPLVLCGALAAAAGRFLLASGSRRLRPRLSPERIAHIGRAQAAISANRRRTAAGFGLFALSPVPSGQLFVGAGLMTVPLLPLTAAFFAGRLVSYSIYVTAATIAERNLGSVALDALTSPAGMAIQIAMLIGLAILVGGIRPRPGPRPPALPGAPKPGRKREPSSGAHHRFAVVSPGCRTRRGCLDSIRSVSDPSGGFDGASETEVEGELSPCICLSAMTAATGETTRWSWRDWSSRRATGTP